MAETEVQRAIVILSSGRAGTSLLAQALAAMGMTLSDKLIEAGYANPDGFFEDAEIVEIHKELQEELGGSPRLPLPAGWTESEVAKKYRPKLRAVLQRQLARTTTIWGFKDPRTCAVLPLWLRVLNAEKVNPSLLLAVRDPAAVVSSLARMTDISTDVAELMWLSRNCDALHYSAGDCFVLHYEDWFTRGIELARELQQYTDLDRYFQGNLEEVIAPIVKPNLNRAVHEPYSIRNEHVLRLYEVLKDCRGSDFDRARLMQCVRECRQAMDGFRGWSTEALRLTQEAAKTSKALQESRAQLKKAKQSDTELPQGQQERRVVEARVKALEGQLAQAQQERQMVQARVKALEGQVAQGQQDRQTAQAEGKALEGQLAQARQQLGKLEAQTTAAHEEAAKLRLEVEQAAERSKQLQQQQAQLHQQLGAGATEVGGLRAERARMMSDLEKNELRQNAYLKQIKALHARVEELSIKRFSTAPEHPPARIEVKQQGLGGPATATVPAPRSADQPQKANGKAPSKAEGRPSLVARARPPQRVLTRRARLWRKFKADPHGYFADSRFAPFRSLRHLFPR